MEVRGRTLLRGTFDAVAEEYDRVRPFEEWEPDAGGFDAFTSFAALHWIDPHVRYAKPARLLRPGGAIAIFDWQDTLSVDGDGFFHWSVRYRPEDYVAFLNTRSSHRLLPEDRRQALFARIRARIGTRDPACVWPASSPSSSRTVVRRRPRGRPTWPSTWPATTLRRGGPGPGLAQADLVGPKSPWATTLGGRRASATAAPRSPSSKTTPPPRCRGGAFRNDPQSPCSSARRAYSAPPAGP